MMIRGISGAVCVMMVCIPSGLAEQGGATHAKPWSQADKIWGEGEMDASRHHVQKHHGRVQHFFVGADHLEIRSGGEEDMLHWDGDVWYGGDLNKLWIKSEGGYDLDRRAIEETEVQVLWSRAISPFFDMQTGLRFDLEPEATTHAVLGVHGLAPYRFEVDAAAFLSEAGKLSASVEVEYEFALTQRLHLVPRLALDWSAQENLSLDEGEGFTNADIGVRLSYDVIREFAPYIGIEWSSRLGDTKDLASGAGENTESTAFLLGVRSWF